MDARPLPFRILVPLVLASWGGLALLGFPAPSIDDLFYSGPAIHLAAGQGLVNPWIAMLDPVGGRFLIYPPLYFAILALWLKLFGIGTASLLLFQAAAASVITFASLLLLRRLRAPAWIAWTWALFLAALLGLSGLRPDLPGIALFVLGVGLEFRSGPSSGPIRTLGAFLLGASVQTLPALAPWGLAFLSFRLLDLAGPERPAFVGRLAAAGLVNAFLFLAIIDFRPAAFLHDFHVHQANHLFGNHHFYRDVWHSPAFVVRIFVLPLLLAAAGALALRRTLAEAGGAPQTRRRILLATLAGLLALGLSLAFIVRSVSDIRLLGLASTSGAVLFAWVGCRGKPHLAPVGFLLGGAAALVFLASYGRGLVEWVDGIATPPDARAVATLRAEALALAPSADVLVVDPVSARIAFDFRLPPRTRDALWLYAWQHPPVGPDSGFEKERAVCLLSPEAFVFRPSIAYPRHVEPRPIRILGHALPRTAANRNELFLVAPGEP